MIFKEFLAKIKRNYQISAPLIEAIAEEYGTKQGRIDWAKTYSDLMRSGKSVTHVGRIEEFICYNMAMETKIIQISTYQQIEAKRRYINQDFEGIVRRWFYKNATGVVRLTDFGFYDGSELIYVSITDADLLYEIAAGQPDSAEKWLVMRWREELEESKTRWLERIRTEGAAVMFAGGELMGDG